MGIFATEKNPAKPSFKKVVRYVREVFGNTISLVAPKVDGVEEFVSFADSDVTTIELKARRSPRGEVVFEYKDLLSLSWKMRGAPIFSPVVGEVGLLLRVVKLPWMGVNESIFDPEVLVRALKNEVELSSEDEVYELAGEDEFDLDDYRIPKYLDLINCQWINFAGVPSLYKEGVNLRDSVNELQFVIPLTDDSYLSIKGDMWRRAHNGGNVFRMNERVPLAPFQEVVEKIIQSLKIEPSEELAPKLNQMVISLSNEAPRLAPSEGYVYSAKSAIKRSSSVGFEPDAGAPKQITPQQASAFIDSLLKPKSIPGSYGFDGPVTYVHHQGDLSPVPLSFRKEVPPPAS